MIDRAKRLAKLLLRLAVSIALLGGIFWLIDGQGLLSRLGRADLRWFGLAVLLGILANIVSAWRWLIIARHLGLFASAGALLPAYGKGVTLNTLLPGATLGGDAYRAIALQKLGNPMLKAAASVALDRLSGLWALFVISWLAWLALLVLPGATVGLSTKLAHLSALLAAVLAPFAARALGAALPLDPHRLPARLLRLLSETARLAQITFVSSLIVQLATIAALMAALAAIGADAPPLYLCAVAAPVFFATALPVSVGGYGTREAALAAYWAAAGLPVEAAVAGALLAGLAVTLQGALWAPLFLFDRGK
ncbi:lysylphosphatidylglycerol synthase transmembrane domain-containing protein [Sulfuricystis multivorans]|uniref:lysylphosphatidylglycerol synthase transmembrane domain-containing protein n=1 Tax=Sulfuricystis multivorans TaxID=2211108 RepID=UPI000F831A74|nr:lysylphosphatidylglycerol synthase transmembrane domain-containing protein [Sulfuricystis multivorans]